MQRGTVFINNEKAGYIEYTAAGKYIFTYDDIYYTDEATQSISLTLPKTHKQYESRVLFPFFYGLLAEGVNKDIQCRLLKIDEEDDFTRLLKTAGTDTIGAITVKGETGTQNK